MTRWDPIEYKVKITYDLDNENYNCRISESSEKGYKEATIHGQTLELAFRALMQNNLIEMFIQKVPVL